MRGNVWHLNCCNPENNFDNDGWSIFNAIFGWTNSATIGSVLSYIFYWLAVMVVLVIMKWKEGRVKLFGIESAAGVRRREYDDAIQVREAEREAAAAAAAAEVVGTWERTGARMSRGGGCRGQPWPGPVGRAVGRRRLRGGRGKTSRALGFFGLRAHVEPPSRSASRCRGGGMNDDE